MSAEVEVVLQVLEELNRRLPKGDHYHAYHWSKCDIVWTSNGTWQEYIPRTSDDNVCAVICLFGERLGVPLPDYFLLPAQDIKLPEWVRFPWTEKEAENAVPLTGTLFELLDAYQKQNRSSGKQPKILVYLKIDSKMFSLTNLAPDQRKYGFETHYRRLCNGDIRLRDRKMQMEYYQQLDWLDCFFTHFLRSEGRPYICYGNADSTDSSNLMDLKARLLKDLSQVLNLPEQGSPTRELKNLEAYQPDDYDILFGRDQTIIQILERLKTLSDKGTPAIVLSGRSGEGKSSVLRAGLVGRLKNGNYPDFGTFCTVLVDSMSLGTMDPLANLEKAINDALDGKLWSKRDGFNTILPEILITELAAAVKNAIEKNTSVNELQKRRLFIGIDQFEELLVAAGEDTRLENSVKELISAVRFLSENGLAWVVFVLPLEHLDRLAKYDSSLRRETVILGRPGDADLQDIISRSFEVAHVPIKDASISLLMEDITAWLSRQEDPGPILPLISVMIKDIVDTSDELELPNVNSVINKLCERAWYGTEDESNETSELNFNRLMRQLVVTGLREGEDIKLLRQCPDRHDAVLNAKQLVNQMRKNRLILQPAAGVLRLAHISIIENWERALTWYKQERDNHLFIAELELMSQKHEREKAQGKQGKLLTDEQDIDRIEDLWLSWVDDMDRLPLSYLRECLMAYFDPGRGSDCWLRSDGKSRLSYCAQIMDEVLLMDYSSKISTLDEGEKKKLIHFANETIGNTTLHFAASCGNLLAMIKLIELGAEPEGRNADQCTPLWLASKFGFDDMVKFLLELNVDANTSDAGEITPLAIAFHSLLSQLDVTHNLDRSENGSNIAAKQAAYLQTIRYLMERGAVLNDAGIRRIREVCENALTYEMTTILDLLHEAGFTFDFIKFITDTPLINAILKQSQQRVELLLKYGVNPNAWGGASTPLTVASERDSENIVQLLLEAGAVPDVLDTYGMSALHYAAANGNTQIISMLLDRGVPFDMVDALGNTPLISAISAGKKDAAQYLLKLGASPNPMTTDEPIPIIKAAQTGNAEMIDLLCRYGAKPDKTDRRNMTALMYAAWFAHTEAVKKLLEWKADVEMVGPNGMTAMMIAEAGYGTTEDQKEESLKILNSVVSKENHI
ncbi:MAG: ankyrin repeat domain-containing protein [Methanosarcina sp.]